MAPNIFGKQPSTLDKIVDGLTHKAVDGAALSDVVKQLQALNQFFQESRNTSQQRIVPHWISLATGSMVRQDIAVARQGWTFYVRLLHVHDNSGTFDSWIRYYCGEYAYALLTFSSGGTASSIEKTWIFDEPLAIQPNKGLFYQATVIGATTIFTTLIGEYRENIK